MKRLISRELKRIKKIKECENSIKGHDFKFSHKQEIKILDDIQVWDEYTCIKCGLGKFQ